MKQGRNKNVLMAVKVHELADNGMNTREIAQSLDISLPMAQYYLRQRVKEEEEREARKKGIATYFWNADEATRIKVAELLHYDYQPEVKDTRADISIAEAYKKLSQQQVDIKEFAKEVNTSCDSGSLLARAKKILDGTISPVDIDENFSNDEIDLLNKSPKFVVRFRSIAWGISSSVTNEDVIEELEKMGIK